MTAPKAITVALDTMILVWGTKKKGRQELIDRALILFRQLDRQKARIVIPSVVVSEYLSYVRPDDHGNVVAELSQRFFISPFDVKCARLAAELWLDGQKRRKKGMARSRVTLRADVLIVASAKSHGAKQFWSHDGNCRKLATKAGMAAYDLPTTEEYLIDVWGEPA